jgi:dTDP-4-amino-4,6-dideoxygalactose transaminase
MTIPVMKPKLAKFEMAEKYLREIDQNRVFTNYGPLVKQVEFRYADYLGVKPENVVALVNATLAIQGCVQISKIQKWAIPNFTFAATAHAVIVAGKELQLVEVNGSDWKMNLEDLNVSNLGIIPVMPFGSPVNIEDYALWDHVVVDAAASLGSTLTNVDKLKPDQFIVYSLHATKVLGAGEGSIIICGSEENAKLLRAWANFGFMETRESSFLGTNAKMTEFAAAYALAALDHKDAEEFEWTKVLSHKKKLMEEIGMLNVSDLYPGFRPYWIFQIQDNTKSLVENLNKNGIGNRTWWSAPISNMPAFSQIEIVGGKSISLELSTRLIGLPMWRDLSLNTVEKIAEIVNLSIE